jgi:hypothetical protein
MLMEDAVVIPIAATGELMPETVQGQVSQMLVL